MNMTMPICDQRELAAPKEAPVTESNKSPMRYALQRMEYNGVWVLSGGSLLMRRRFLGRADAIECARGDCIPNRGTLREVTDGKVVADIEFAAVLSSAVAAVVAAIISR